LDDFQHHFWLKKRNVLDAGFSLLPGQSMKPAAVDLLDASIRVSITFKNPFHTFQKIHCLFITKTSQVPLYTVITESSSLFLCIGSNRVGLILLSGGGKRTGIRNAVCSTKMRQWIPSNISTSLKTNLCHKRLDLSTAMLEHT
jgi:hypothetical protein